MNFGPVFAKVSLAIAIYGGAAGLLRLFYEIDDELKSCGKERVRKSRIFYSTMVCVPLFIKMSMTHPAVWISIWLLGVYLAVASATDALIYQVYDILQYVGVLGGGIWLWLQCPSQSQGISLLLFAAVQYLVFMRMYGKADGMGYCICALYLSGKGLGLDGYLYQMLAGFLILTVVQLVKRNVSDNGKLKQAVALYPYITCGFMVLWCSV